MLISVVLQKDVMTVLLTASSTLTGLSLIALGVVASRLRPPFLFVLLSTLAVCVGAACTLMAGLWFSLSNHPSNLYEPVTYLFPIQVGILMVTTVVAVFTLSLPDRTDHVR
jgi:hypothetical protein